MAALGHYRTAIKNGMGPKRRLELFKELDNQLSAPIYLEEVLQIANKPILAEIMKHFGPDTGQTLIRSYDPLELKLQLHICCLSILNKVLRYDTEKFFSLNILQSGHFNDLLSMLEYEKTHRDCCVGATTTRGAESFNRLLTQLQGRDLKVLWKKVLPQASKYGEDLFRVVLESDEGLLSERMEGVVDALHFRSARTNTNSTIRCRVSHVVSPGYMWLQEDLLLLARLQRELREMSLEPLPRGYANKHVVARIEGGFTFRATVLDGSSPQDDNVTVIATDFGWTTTLPCSSLHPSTTISGIPPEHTLAILCKLDDVCPNPSPVLAGAVSALAMLCNEHWTPAVFPDHAQTLLSLLNSSRDLAVTTSLVYLFAAGAQTTSREFIEPLSSILPRFIECVDVMRAAMLLYRNTLRNIPRWFHRLIFGVLEIYQRHGADPAVQEHFSYIIHKAMEGVPVEEADPKERQEEEEQESVVTATPLPALAAPSVEDAIAPSPFLPLAGIDTSHRFNHLEPITEHGIFPGRKVSFMRNYDTSMYRDRLAREICSMVNEDGGTIYIGVNDVDNTITGLKLNRKERDIINLLVDDMCTDNDFIKSKGSDKIPSSLVSVEFEKINNLYNTRLASNRGISDDLEIAIISVDVTGWEGDLFVFNETQDKGAVPAENYDWVFWVRNERGLSRHHNDVRQATARRELKARKRD